MTGFSRPDENTLGVIVGRGRRTVPGASAARALRATANIATLGTGHLGIGASLICALQGAYGLGLALAHLPAYPDPTPAVFAWVLFVAAFVTAAVTLSAIGERLPNWLFVVFLVALAAIVALDFAAIWPLGNIGGYATASISAGFGLLVVVTLRGPREILAVTALLGIAFVLAILATTPLTPETVPVQLTALALAVMPGIVGSYVVRLFRRMVAVDLDRVLVQSTVSAPRFAVGMLASEELARLDLDAEQLFDSIADGTSPLPLDPKTASIAATLATELRLHLIEGRRETWLYHAVSESELLGRNVTLVDKGSLAGLLDPGQRDGLLSAVWLLVTNTTKSATTHSVRVEIGPVAGTEQTDRGHRLVVPITVTTTGVARSRVDPSTWGAFRRVGSYSDSSENASVRVDVRALVENPAR